MNSASEGKGNAASANALQQILCLPASDSPRNQIIAELCAYGFNCAEIAKFVGLTRQRVSQILRSLHIKPKARKITIDCETCGNPFTKFRSKIVTYGQRFCSLDRQGQRIARATVSKYFDLQPSHVVHHEDRDNRNNNPSNLRVFASQADHMAYHHGSDVQPLWDGRKVVAQ